MPDYTYAAAGTVAPSVLAHLTLHLNAARERGEDGFAMLPDERAITRMIDTAFWASLRREEGTEPKISLAFLTREQALNPLVFERSVPLEPAALTRLSAVVERRGIHLGIAYQGGDLLAWGIVRTIPKYCCVIEVAEPGLLVIKHHRGEVQAKFVNVAVLQGDSVKVIDEHASSLPDCPSLLTSLLAFDSPSTWAGSVNVLVQLAVSMRAHGRGGVLLVVPEGTDAWRQSIVHPPTYSVSPPFNELTGLAAGPAEGITQRAWREELNRSVDEVASLTAIDGATVITSAFHVLAFGVKVARRKGGTQIDQLTLTEPIEGTDARILSPADIGATRHLAGAQFIHDQRDALALVASQDGRFTVFAWSPCEGMVHAHRIETLLL
jgi:sensor domain DACNV-containing protein